MFRKPSKPKNLRRKERDNEIEDVDEVERRQASDKDPAEQAAASRPRLGRHGRPVDGILGFSTASTKRRKEDDETADDGPGTASRFGYESTRQVQVQSDNRATATLETETEFDRDARALREKYLKRAEEALKGGGGEGGTDDRVYRGMTGYIDHTAGFRREHTVSSEKGGGAHGPLRASQHIRWSVRFDYQPDICKDYKETGYCGYGDSCKFMHDRGDYKSGWQLERDWEEKERLRKEAVARGEDVTGGKDGDGGGEDDDEDALPFACFICRQPFVDPVVTKCRHYFCEHCALKHHSKNKNCFVCNKPTQGVFNTAHEIVRKAKEAKRAEAAKEGDR